MESIAEKLTLDNIDKSDWQTYQFDQIARNISERVEPTETDLEIYVGLEHIDSDSIHIKRFGKREDVSGTKLRCYPGDVIFGRRRAYQRKAAIVTFDGFCSAHSLVLRANPSGMLPELFPFFLHSDTFMHRAVDISVGSLSPTINWGDLKKQEFLLPPKDQQEQIAELLWAGDEMIEREVKVLAALEKYYKVKKHKLLNGHDLIEGEEKLPIEWKEYSIEEISKVIDYRGKTPTKSEKGIRLITAKNVREGWLDKYPEEFIAETDYDAWMRRGIPKKGDILFTTEAPLGNVALVDIDEKFALAQRIVCLQPNELIYSNFLKYALDNSTVKSNILSKATGTTVMGIRSSLLKKVLLLIPPINQQKFITSILDALDSTISEVESKILQSKFLQKSLINQFF